MKNGVEFDPGFAPYILAFQGTVNYLYLDINKFKNFSQRKIKFRQYYKKFIDLFNNNLGFYIGCLLWASYIKSLPEQEILNNHCLGKEYNEEENTLETDFMIRFVELFPKDMKYFMNEPFDFDKETKQIIEMYKEFLIINKGFVETKYISDLKLPDKIKTNNIDELKNKIEEAISSGDLSLLVECKSLIL